MHQNMPKTILLVEDDPTMRSLLKTLLQFEGFQVVIQNPEDTLEEVKMIIQQEKPAVIILDVFMHQFNGFDLLDVIRQDKEIQDTKVIMSSGADVRDRCLEEGANLFLLKPYMPEELIQSINTLTADEGGTERE